MTHVKPLGHKSYGSTPHLPGSRLGPGDHHCPEGQANICLVKTRDRHDTIIVTEKLDGSNVAVANVGGKIIALGRAGWPAQTSKYVQHQYFAHWVREREGLFKEKINPGERLVGEWLAQAHGTIYELQHEPFVPFALMVGMKHLPMKQVIDVTLGCGLSLPGLLSFKETPLSIEKAMSMLENRGFHGAIDPVEGAVWRVERKGEFDFMAKFVRHDKTDGKYLPEISGKEAIWHWRP
jgi:hypothetical protein